MVTQDAPPELPEGVTVLGRLSDDELADEYGRAWVFCLPSSYEGFGIPYAEAMTAGLPVVATPNVGARYVTDEGAVGSLVELPGSAVHWPTCSPTATSASGSRPPAGPARSRSTCGGSRSATKRSTGRRCAAWADVDHARGNVHDEVRHRSGRGPSTGP